jgi:hypothetical protein
MSAGTDESCVFDPETIELMRQCLDLAWSQLTSSERRMQLKSTVAARILRAAAQGERDPHRLVACGLLLHVAAPSVAEGSQTATSKSSTAH